MIEVDSRCRWWSIKDMGGVRCVRVSDHTGDHRDVTGRTWSDRFGVREHGLSEDELLTAHEWIESTNPDRGISYP